MRTPVKKVEEYIKEDEFSSIEDDNDRRRNPNKSEVTNNATLSGKKGESKILSLDDDLQLY